MRIAINVEQLFYRAPGGTGRYTARLAGTMAREFSADVVMPFTAWHGRRSIDQVLSSSGLDGAGLARAVRLPLPRPVLSDVWNSLSFPPPGLFSASLRGAEIVHAPSPAVPPTRKPLVVSVHDAGPALFPSSYPRRGLRFHHLALARTAKKASVVLTGTQAAAAEIAAESPIPRALIEVVPYGVDQAHATPVEVTAVAHKFQLDGAPYVLWVGSLEPRKNVGTLVAAMARLSLAGEVPHRLVLAGPLGWLHADLIADRDRAVLGDKLRVTGAVSDAELRALYAGAHLFAFPSLHEGFGLPVLEAMVQGAPVVCSDIPALAEVAGGAAELVAPCDVDGWVDAIGAIASSGEGRAWRAAAGHDWVKDFTWGRTARMTRAVYERVLGGTAR